MKFDSVLARCLVLAVAALAAMPFSTDASGIRGGDDIPQCDTTETRSANCAGCTSENKTQCKGCYEGTTQATIKCKEISDACDGSGCTAGQKNAGDGGVTCIAQQCPSGTGTPGMATLP